LFSAIKRFATSLAQADGLRDRPAVLSSNWKNLVKSAKRPFSVNRGARAPQEIFAQRYRAAQVPLVMNFSPLNRLLCHGQERPRPLRKYGFRSSASTAVTPSHMAQSGLAV